MEEKRQRKFSPLVIILIIVVLVGIMISSKYNGLVRKQEDVNKTWAEVQTQYQRRADLIPNLVETVKGYAKHEEETLENIAKLRSGYTDAKTPEDYEKLDTELAKNINIVVENYPDLKANENFLSLQDELAGTENRIAVARRDFNNEATEFNKSVRIFPNNIFASMLGFGKFKTFEAQAGAENAPSVDFGK
ncbi:LemA family protein [Peptostreptococcaceae bacterium oral taxon 929]|nr:LemA family protein [Peptostreptococcaceae bacterium oral taxon 929]